MNYKKALRVVLTALDGQPHHIRELQATRGLPDNPIDILITDYNTNAGKPEPVVYPINHGTHIIQFHDETFVWYDEAGLQGGLAYSLKQAQTDLKRYADSLERRYEEPERMVDVVTITRSLAGRLQERLDPHRDARDWGELANVLLGTVKIVCKACGWPHINTTETCDDATARERGKT